MALQHKNKCENTTILQVIVCRVWLKRGPIHRVPTQDRFLYSYAPLVQVLLSIVRGLEVSSIQVLYNYRTFSCMVHGLLSVIRHMSLLRVSVNGESTVYTKINMNSVLAQLAIIGPDTDLLYHYNGPLVFLDGSSVSTNCQFYQPKVIIRLVFSLQIIMESSDNAQILLSSASLKILTRTLISTLIFL